MTKEERRAYARKWYAANKARVREQQKIAHIADPDKRRRYYRARYEKDPTKFKGWVRKSVLKTEYGLTPESFVALVARQGGMCAICYEWLGNGPGERRPHIDHDHKGHVRSIRGVLCGPCNQGLGLFYDKPDVLRRAADYIEKNG